MEHLTQIVMLAVRASLMLMILAVGLDSTPREALYVLRRPNVLMRAVLAFAVVVPVFAALVVAALPLERAVKIGILLMAVSPLPPFMPAKERLMGARRRYVYGLLVAISLLAVALVPITVAILSRVFATEASISVGPVLRLVLVSLFLPLVVGMLIRHFAPAAAVRAVPIVNKAGIIMLMATVLPIAYKVLPQITHLIGNGTVAAMVVVILGALLAGHLLGGPEPADQAALAIGCTTRHPGVALLVAHANFTDPLLQAAILLFLVIGVLVGLPYAAWYKRHHPLALQ
jgi:BASS family bile acid:Na+ symporter